MSSTNESKYKTPRALEMAVKAAAKKSPLGTERGIAAFYRDRLLVRIFDGSDDYVLKGGQGLLARTIGARESRDIDLATYTLSIDEAVAELKARASRDLGDYLTYAFDSARPIKLEDGYRDGYHVSFVAWLGGTKRLNKVGVDLVAQRLERTKTDLVSPANRLAIEGLVTCDYPVLNEASHIADKVCACMQEYPGGRPSSRVRDLVDLAVYATTARVEADELRAAINREAKHRGMPEPNRFAVPGYWREAVGRRMYAQAVSMTRLPEGFDDLDVAYELVGRFIDPVLLGDAVGRVWDPVALCWETSFMQVIV